MKSRKFSLISLLLLAFSVQAFACGPWYYEPQTYLMYRAYLPSSNLEEWAYNTKSGDNCLLWRNQCGKGASAEDIYQIVYKSSPEDLEGLLSHSKSGRKLAQTNTFAAALWNDSEAAELLVLAKQCETARSELNSPWYYPASRDETPFGLDEIARKAAEYNGDRFRSRYALQRIRALFSLRDYDECINYWNDVKDSLDDDVIKEMTEQYIAGAYYHIGDTETAKEYYLRLNDGAGLYYCFRDGKTPWHEVMYKYAPNCKELRDWMAQKVACEEKVFYNGDEYWKTGLPAEDVKKCNELAGFCARAASEGKVSDPDFWYYSEAYLKFLVGKKGEAYGLLRKAGQSKGTQQMKDNIRVFKLYLDSMLKPWSPSYEKEMVAELGWLDGMIVKHLEEARQETIDDGVYKMGINLSYFYWNDMMRKIVLSSIVPKLLENHREESAIRFANMADNRLLNLVGSVRAGRYDKDKGRWVSEERTLAQMRKGDCFNPHDYSNALFQLIDTMNVVHLERYVNSLGKATSSVDVFLDERGYTDRAFFQELIGTKYIREMKYPEAVRWLSCLPAGYQKRLNTYKVGYLDEDPFAQSKQPIKDNSDYKLRFAKKMVQLESTIRTTKDPVECAKLKARYATGIRNSVSICWGMSFYRKSVVDTDTEYFGRTYFSRKRDAAFSKADKIFQEAIGDCPDREATAAILYSLGNMKIVAEDYPETKSAALIRGECDKLVDYHLERSERFKDGAGGGPYEFEAKAARTIR